MGLRRDDCYQRGLCFRELFHIDYTLIIVSLADFRTIVHAVAAQDDMVSVDLRHTVRPALSELKEIAVRKTHEYRNRSLELQDQVYKNEEQQVGR